MKHWWIVPFRMASARTWLRLTDLRLIYTVIFPSA